MEITSLHTINQTAKHFLQQIGNKKVFAFNGVMGAGKTTFIKAICEELGVKEPINSPTFSIINEYEADNGKIIYHFDCYRINNVSEALNIGAEEYLYSGNFCFIEWAENILPILPFGTVMVEIKEVENQKRVVILEN
jgi:tRNA threonylcarbamoyladenosine biosynthesis protein TsaE